MIHPKKFGPPLPFSHLQPTPTHAQKCQSDPAKSHAARIADPPMWVASSAASLLRFSARIADSRSAGRIGMGSSSVRNPVSAAPSSLAFAPRNHVRGSCKSQYLASIGVTICVYVCVCIHMYVCERERVLQVTMPCLYRCNYMCVCVCVYTYVCV